MGITLVKEQNFKKLINFLKNSKFLRKAKYVKYRIGDKEFVYVTLYSSLVSKSIKKFFENIIVEEASAIDCPETREQIIKRGASILKYIYEKKLTYIEFDLKKEEDIKNFIILLRLIKFLKNRFNVNITSYRFKNGIITFYINEKQYLELWSLFTDKK